MIDRINNNYTDPYNNQNRTKVNASSEDLPKFMLDYDEKGVVWDRQEKTVEEKTVKPANKPKTDVNRIDSKSVATQPKADTAPAKNNVSLFSSIKNFFKGIFDFIWYGKSSKAADNTEESSTETTKTIGKNLTAEEKDALIRDLIRKKDNDAVMDILTDHHKNMPARCTDMITYYDRYGRIVNDSDTNKTRILKGDKGTINL